MAIKYTFNYKKENTKYLAVHNAGGIGNDALAKSQHLTAEQIDNAHRQRFGMLSSLGRWGGYNFYIEADGKVTQFRAIGEVTAAQKGTNNDGVAISVCLAGNFTKGVELPTKAQIKSLGELYAQLPLVNPYNILPHRRLQTGTSCYGSALPDDWARKTITLPPEFPPVEEVSIYDLIKLRDLLIQLIAALKRKASLLGGLILGRHEMGCHEVDVRG